jgi:hypothetical protein
MSSIYERALGPDSPRLHPQIQRRFGFSSSDGIASIGSGVMDEIWKGSFYTEPFLRVGSWRRISFLRRDDTSRSRSRTMPSSINSAERPFRGSERSNRVGGVGSMRTWSIATLDVGSSTTWDHTSTWRLISTFRWTRLVA